MPVIFIQRASLKTSCCRYGDITPDHGVSRDFTIFYLCLSVLLIGAVMAISREYQSVVRKKGQWDKSMQLAERMRSLKQEMDEVKDSETSSSQTDNEAPPPAPHGAPKASARRKTARYVVAFNVGEGFLTLHCFADPV